MDDASVNRSGGGYGRGQKVRGPQISGANLAPLGPRQPHSWTPSFPRFVLTSTVVKRPDVNNFICCI